MAIRFGLNCVVLDSEGWAGATPQGDRLGIRFDESVRVVVTEDFLRRALHLIEHCREEDAKRRAANAQVVDDATLKLGA